MIDWLIAMSVVLVFAGCGYACWKLGEIEGVLKGRESMARELVRSSILMPGTLPACGDDDDELALQQRRWWS